MRKGSHGGKLKNFMDYVYSVITILAGCGVFLLGFKWLRRCRHGGSTEFRHHYGDGDRVCEYGHYVFKTSRNDHHGREHRHDDHGADRGVAGI